MENRISFPVLGLEFNIDRVAFNIFGFEIYWYAIIITLGIVAGYFYAVAEGKKQNISSDTFSEILLVGIPSAILCARGYYVFSKWDYYSKNIGEIFNLRGGGIAIYGAIIGAVVAVLIYCRAKKYNTLKLFDIASVSLLIGQAVGRWGNFVNAEAHGYETETFFKMGIWSDTLGKFIYYHPTFLYESVWNFAGVILLHCLSKKKKVDGQIFFLYILWYGLGRFFIERLRTDSLMLGMFRISQIVALISVITGGIVSVLLYIKGRNRAD